MRRTSLATRALLGAGVLVLGLGTAFSSARAQFAPGRVYYRPTYAAPAPYYAPRVYAAPRYVYVNPSLNGYNRGPVGPGPARDWSTGRGVPLAKPWLRPLRP